MSVEDELIVPKGMEVQVEEWKLAPGRLVDGTLHCSGQLGFDASGTLPDDAEAQITNAFEALKAVLAAAGASFDDVVEMSSFHVGLQDQLEAFGRVRDRYLRAPYPAQTAVGVAELGAPGALVEINVKARVPGERASRAREAAPDFFELAFGQRAHRALRPDPVPEELIEKILRAGTHAPSAKNTQPWRFVVVRDEAVRKAIGEHARAAWVGFARDASDDQDDPIFQDVDRWAMGGLAEAPVIIVLCGDTTCMPADQMGSSVYPAAQNILLAASALGLGSLMSNLPLYSPDGGFAKTLGLPDHIVPFATLPIGYPARKLGKPRRRPVSEITSRDRWGNAW